MSLRQSRAKHRRKRIFRPGGLLKRVPARWELTIVILLVSTLALAAMAMGGSSREPAAVQPVQAEPAAAAPEAPAQPALSPGSPVPGPDAVYVFKAYGRAHGVGLCMDGVKYRALAGHSYMDIINHYYTGVQVVQTDDSRPIRVRGNDGRVRVMAMRDYLYHLAEEPEDYPEQGLKVLYIAARTYLLSVIERGKHAAEGFDVCSSGDCCQAYNESKNLAASPNNVNAVNTTAGLTLFYDGHVINAAYSGSCGGHTENYEDVFTGGPAYPYLRGKPDEFCMQSPRSTAVVELNVAQLQARLNASAATSVGQLHMVDLSDRTPGGRVRTVTVSGSEGAKQFTGKQLMSMLGVTSTRIEYSFR